MLLLALLVLFIFVLFYFYIQSKYSGVSLVDIAWGGVTSYFLGLILLGLFDNKLEDGIYYLMLMISAITFLLFTFYALILTPINKKSELSTFSLDINNFTLNILIFFIVIFNVAFLILIIKNLLPLVLASFVDGKGTVLLSLRKAIASGEHGYYAPGLVKQIRDILAPAVIGYLITREVVKYRKIKVSLVFFSSLVAMIVGGQRSPVMVLILIILFAYISKHKQLLNKKNFFYLTFLGLLLIQALNMLLGRGESGFSIENLVFTISSILDRIFVTVPKENYHVFSFLLTMKIDAFQLWFSDLQIILPMKTDGSFSNQLHQMLGGSSQGNSVLGLPIDMYINSGLAGIFVFSFIFLVFLTFCELCIKTVNFKPLNQIKIVLMLNLPFIYSPYYFLLNGGLWLAVLIPIAYLFKPNENSKCLR